jgi:hypothetical protein
MLHNVHNGRKGKIRNIHHCKSWMMLQKKFKGNSYWSLPFLVQFPVVGIHWWIVDLLII